MTLLCFRGLFVSAGGESVVKGRVHRSDDITDLTMGDLFRPSETTNGAIYRNVVSRHLTEQLRFLEDTNGNINSH